MADIVADIYPFLTVKRRQAIVGWNLQRLRDGIVTKAGQPIPEENMAKRRLLADVLHKLNQREDVDIPGWCKEPSYRVDPGWYLRSSIIWAKGLSFCESYAGSCMPESVTDRPTSAHEHVFLLAKAPRYYYDNEAVKETAVRLDNFHGAYVSASGRTMERNGRQEGSLATGTRNLRNVWAINPAGFPGAHFATFPPALVEPCIKAGTSERGCCPTCGAPWRRVVERTALGERDDTGRTHGRAEQRMGKAAPPERGWEATNTTLGWQPTCGCPEHEPVPCVVLDVFGGAGTTMLVADRLGRHGVGVELSGEYTRMARRRCYQDAPLLAFAATEGAHEPSTGNGAHHGTA